MSHQVYRSGGRALHVAEQGPDADLTGSVMEEVNPEDIGLVESVLEPIAVEVFDVVEDGS